MLPSGRQLWLPDRLLANLPCHLQDAKLQLQPQADMYWLSISAC